MFAGIKQPFFLSIQSKCASCRSGSRSVEMPTSFPWIISYCGSLPRPRRVWPAHEPVLVGSAQQSCLIRCSLRQYRRIEEEIRLVQRISESFSPRAVAWPPSSRRGRLFSYKSRRNFFVVIFSSSLPRQWVKEGNKTGVQLWWCAVSRLILHFAGRSCNSTLTELHCSVQGM